MKKPIKCAGAAIMSAAVAFSFTAFTAGSAAAYTADEPAEIYSYELDVELSGKYEDAAQAIYEALKSCKSDVDVQKFGITRTEAASLYYGVLEVHPDIFYVENVASYNYLIDGTVTKYNLNYTHDTTEVAEMKEKFDARVDEITQLVSDDMTDLEKAVVLHDELAASCNYDSTLEKSTAYDAIVGGEAVCQGYSYAYAYLLSLVGVESEFAESDTMNHMWNRVNIDGEWYNVDVTWDDPAFAGRGQAYHTYFLLSDNKIASDDMESRHYDYTSVHTAADTSYDDALLHGIDTRLCRVSDGYYAICNESDDTYAKCLIKYDPTNDTAEDVKDFDFRWSAGVNYYWSDNYMALQVYDGLLYFNTPDSLCSYDVSTGEQSTVVEDVLGDDKSSSTDACYGIVLKGNEIYAAIAESPNTSDVSIKLVKNIEPTEPTVEPAIGVKSKVTLSDGTLAEVYFGDADRDGSILISDVTYVQKAIARFSGLDEIQTAAADVDFNGAVNIKDAADIQKYAAEMV